MTNHGLDCYVIKVKIYVSMNFTALESVRATLASFSQDPDK